MILFIGFGTYKKTMLFYENWKPKKHITKQKSTKKGQPTPNFKMECQSCLVRTFLFPVWYLGCWCFGFVCFCVLSCFWFFPSPIKNIMVLFFLNSIKITVAFWFFGCLWFWCIVIVGFSMHRQGDVTVVKEHISFSASMDVYFHVWAKNLLGGFGILGLRWWGCLVWLNRVWYGLIWRRACGEDGKSVDTRWRESFGWQWPKHMTRPGLETGM